MNRWTAIAAILVWALSCLVVNYWCYKVATFYNCETEDIFYAYRDGRAIVEGHNPYTRIHASDMEANDKYATYLPGAYLLSAAAQKAGLVKFSRWLKYWRKALFLLHLAIGFVIFLEIFGITGSLSACMFACTIWFFNRWSLYVERVSHLDHLPLFLFMLGLYLRRKHARIAWLLYGASLAIKQMAIFAVPILLIDAWLSAQPSRRVKDLLISVVMISIVPLAVSLPFLVLDAQALIKSIMFSMTRQPNQHMSAAALLDSMGFKGAFARLPVLVLFGVTYVLFASRRLAFYPALFAHFVVFLYFNPVVYRQYFLWSVPFTLIVIFGVLPSYINGQRPPTPVASG